MAKVPLKLVAPTIEKRTVDSKIVAAVRPSRRPNAVYRTREHLTETEVEKLIEAAKGNRWGHRDATMVLVAYRHGLRASELVDLRGPRSTLQRRCCTCAEPRAAPLLRIRSVATS